CSGSGGCPRRCGWLRATGRARATPRWGRPGGDARLAALLLPEPRAPDRRPQHRDATRIPLRNHLAIAAAADRVEGVVERPPELHARYARLCKTSHGSAIEPPNAKRPRSAETGLSGAPCVAARGGLEPPTS